MSANSKIEWTNAAVRELFRRDAKMNICGYCDIDSPGTCESCDDLIDDVRRVVLANTPDEAERVLAGADWPGGRAQAESLRREAANFDGRTWDEMPEITK